MSQEFPYMLPTPPTSTGSDTVRRDRFPSSDDSISSTGLLQVYTGDEFRHGAPFPNLRALPQQTRFIDHSSPEYKSFLKIQVAIIRILAQREIQVGDVDLVHRWDSWQKGTEGIITVFTRAVKSDHWGNAVAEILDLIYQHNYTTWMVEILDRRALQYYFPPVLSQSFASGWPVIEAEILDLLGTGPNWRTMTLLNQGHTKAISATTIIIWISDSADQIWQSLILNKVRGLVQVFKGIRVAFIRSS